MKVVDGLPEVFGMKIQPYDLVPGDPKALEHWTTEALNGELEMRARAGTLD